MSKPATTARPTKKPAPAPIKPQAGAAKKPAPPPVKPQTKSVAAPRKPPPAARPPPAATKKPVPRAPTKPQVSTPKTVAKPSVKAPQAKAAPAAEQAPKADNWISRTVQSKVQQAGDYAGGWVNSIADKVNNVGEGLGNTITNQTRYWGQGVAEKGNEIKDSVGIGGPRISTAGNPLGIAGQGAGKGSAPGGKVEKGFRNAGKGSGTNPLGLA